MWIGKGILAGLGIFIVTSTFYGIAYIVYHLVQAAKAGPKESYTATSIGVILFHPYLWLWLLTSIAIGLWIMKRRGG